MKKGLLLAVTALVILTLAAAAFAQDESSPVKGKIIAPPSTRGIPQVKVRTPLYIFQPDNFTPNTPPASAETPGSIACIYGVTPPTNGCPRQGSPVATGGAKAIAVVDYGHNSTLQADFNTFNAQFGLPTQTLTFICDCDSCPVNDGTGWDVETALDTEYAHSMAPNAQIIVSQFCSDPFEGGTQAAEYLGGQAVAAAGGGEESNSFGENEFQGEQQYDQYMSVPTVVYFASAGDSGLGTAYPMASPNVVAAGGTSIVRGSNGLWTGAEYCWNGSGGGISEFEALPQYQLYLSNKFGTKRGTPDWASDANPGTGVAVYSTTGCGGWCQVGGTSVSSPTLAGIVNAAGNFHNNNQVELGNTYHDYFEGILTYRRAFYDITVGSNGSPAGTGWDECTGLGSPRGDSYF
ncbi:MAG TPA: S53 family peptidase [Bryocella sp.]|nr:S53 family peptidase [Bryocella sp.]